MRKLMIMLAMIVGFMGQKSLGTELVFNYAEEQPVVTEEVCGLVEYQPDGDTIVIYSDNSSILINRRDNLYIMWLPETEDYEYHYATEEELMNAIGEYHGPVANLTYPEGSTLNPNGYIEVEQELNKVSDEVLELLERTGIKIYYSDKVIDNHEDNMGLAEGRMVLGYYHTIDNYIMMRESKYAIEGALLHELGHAIDNHLGLRYNQTIIDSYMNHEVSFTNANNSDYYYSSVAEYIAQSILEYYNDTLDKDTVMYQELDYILGE
jgi:hypothetical protein